MPRFGGWTDGALQGIIKPGRISGVGAQFNPARGDTPLDMLPAEEAVKEALKIVRSKSQFAKSQFAVSHRIAVAAGVPRV